MNQPVALPPTFVSQLVAWQRADGRHHLPWQQQREPYRVWLSEVMLQQTQVVTVISYFDRFLTAFPTVQALAAAPQSDVLSLWAGLGYYSRARMLHRCAQALVDQHGGVFPSTVDALVKLPGIGPSTAAAIASFCYGVPVSIYDGNVKRVLSRLLAFEGDLSTTAASKQLHEKAQALLTLGLASGAAAPCEVMPAYTQGLMDLGATVCHLRSPQCETCPVQSLCAARAAGAQTQYPVKLKKLKRTTERWLWLRIQTPGAIWLERRPQKGVWAGMQAPPLFDSELSLHTWLHAQGISKVAIEKAETGDVIKHVLTHKDLYLTPVTVSLDQVFVRAPDTLLQGDWVPIEALTSAALPAPARKWLLGETRL